MVDDRKNENSRGKVNFSVQERDSNDDVKKEPETERSRADRQGETSEDREMEKERAREYYAKPFFCNVMAL